MSPLPDVLTNVGISAFGIGLPVLSPTWTSGTMPIVASDGMALTLGAGTWFAPIGGTVRRLAAGAARPTLIAADASMSTSAGTLVTLFPQAYLRLARLYAKDLESGTGTPRPERALGLPARPTPCFFFFSSTTTPTGTDGQIAAGEDVGHAGDLTVFDRDGFAIDVLAVASAFSAFAATNHPLEQRAWGAPFDSNPQVKQIAALAGTSVVRIHLCDHAGIPHTGTNLTGLTAVTAASGLFTLNASGGAGSNLSGSVGKSAGTGASGSFPDEVQRLLKLGLATTGRLGDTVSFPALSAGVTLSRDYFSLRVVEYKSFLLGTPDPSYAGTKVHKQPIVRINEPSSLLADGNDVLAAATAALTGATTESLAVAQTIDGAFAAPATLGTSAHWPAFPTTIATPASAGAVAMSLRSGFAPVATWFDDGDPATANVDVLLTLSGLPVEAAVRVYHRRFVADAREARGDGAGGVAPASGSLTLRLHDPFELRRPGVADSAIVIPTHATLNVDVVVVKRTGEARVFGHVSAPVGAAVTTAPSTGTNVFGTAARRGITSGGVLGLATRPLGTPTSALDAALTLLGENNPRDAARLPTMARRDLLVAGLAAATGGSWKSVLASGRLTGEAHSANPRLGSPGGPGGRETQVTGISTQGGRLAYDIARMAFRRTTNIVTRLVELANSKWTEPAEPAALAAGAAPSATQGTTVGAVLQTISPNVETPELAFLKTLIDPNSTTRPTTWDDLVTWVATNLPTNLPLRSNLVSQINSLRGNAAGTRLFAELEREIMSSAWGRRDAQWALKDAIGRARRFIYIESPGIAPTVRTYTGGETIPPFAVDLFQAINTRLTNAKGLHVIFCAPKYADYASGYEPSAAREVADRKIAMSGLTTASDPDPAVSRVVAFHPIGFPGRASRIETTVVIVDDVWAMVGSSTFRRRGLTFDGGSDVVIGDLDLVDGVSPAISAFRRALMASRIGVSTAAFPTIPDPTSVRLRDGVEAFHAIRSQLIGGGLGRIEPLWNGETPGIAPISPTAIGESLGNPDGEEYDLAGTIALAAIAAMNAF